MQNYVKCDKIYKLIIKEKKKLRVIENLEKSIKENNKIIEELLKIDNQYCKTKINANMLVEIIQKFF